MLAEILITTFFRTLIELLPFLAVLAIELKGKRFHQVYAEQFKMVADADILPTFNDSNEDDISAVQEVAQFSVARHDTIKYASYSFFVITVIFFSKIPEVLDLDISNAGQIAIFFVGVLLWAAAAYKLYGWRTDATVFYRNITPFDYFRDPGDEPHRRSQTIPLIGEVSLLRHHADILLINGTPVLLVLIANGLLVIIRIYTMPTISISALTTLI
ncbi:hypothetical protein [Haloarcula sp. K1]|uniref:hypothetical protein n=1 Tax=Haloarcula sp. K1 TaxID=1622207 RepID=UPI0007BBF53B|nr:hypothetical protein [Haloarcula sp. K1]KZX49706.1 hypothetical protein AV929_18565 [Haloarcula sp. K1]